MISKKYIPIALFILVLLCELYLPSYKINYAIQLLLLLIIVLNTKATISKDFLKTISPLLFIFLLGFVGYFFNFYSLSATIKDITYFSKPIIGLLLSYLLFKQGYDLILYLKTIFFVGSLTAFIHLFGIFVLGDFTSNSIHDIRSDNGLDNFIEIFAFYILLFSKKYINKDIIDKKWIKIVVLVLLLLSIYLYYSRTMLVVFFLIGFSIAGYTKITKKTIFYLGIATLFISLLYVYLFSVNLDRNAKGVESFLYKIKIAPEEIFKTNIDRENHKNLWDHWRGYEVKRALSLMKENPSSFFIGTGYGSLVNLKFKAPIGEGGMKYISRLHNGYAFVFYKTGFFGLIFIFIFMINLYIKIYRNNIINSKQVFLNKLVSSIGLFYLFTTLIITGIYIPRDIIVFLLGGLLSFDSYKTIMQVEKT